MIIIEQKDFLFELMNKFESGNIDEMTLKSGDFEITMKKHNIAVKSDETLPLVKNENVLIKPVVNPENSAPASSENERIIKAPFIGIYYSAPLPGADEFVRLGQKVKRGDILCIISAMKVMNEIESEYDGEIVEIYCSNDSSVQYGEDLFKIKLSDYKGEPNII